MSTDTEARSRALREELAQARSQLTAERNQRALEEAAAREQSSQDALSRHQRLMDQLNDLKTLLSGQYDEQVRHRERAERDMAEENRRRSEKEARAAELGNMGSRIEQDRETERARLEEERAAAATKPTVETLLQEIRRNSDEHKDMISDLSHQISEDSARRHERLQQMLLASASARESMSFSDGSQ